MQEQTTETDFAMTEQPAPRKRGRPSGKATKDLRPALLEAAIDLFAQNGFDGVSLSQISGQVGADVALTRYYFGSKADLWEAAVQRLAEAFATELAKALPKQAGSASERLAALIRAFVVASARWPQVSRIIVFDGDTADARGAFIATHLVTPFYNGLTELISAAQAEGSVADVSARTVFFMITHGGSFPMALPALTNRFPGDGILSPDGVEAHAQAIIAMLIRPGSPA
ncbi:MAG: TetR/AcrR family transcriptional regulator [Shimia sp.]|uniref:TetR/AcrR family transcriptional regulator n=1 Tax=Shimia sp. TaxID=1954381 RepID=UPI004058F94C